MLYISVPGTVIKIKIGSQNEMDGLGLDQVVELTMTLFSPHSLHLSRGESWYNMIFPLRIKVVLKDLGMTPGSRYLCYLDCSAFSVSLMQKETCFSHSLLRSGASNFWSSELN